MVEHARVAVIGGGNMGASVLYHLALEGWSDCVLLEKAELTSGATWHAAGLVSRMVGGVTLGGLHDYAVDLYKSIEGKTGQSVSWHGCGSLRVATSREHVDWISHVYDGVRARNVDVELVSADEVGRLNPLYDIEAAGVRAGLLTRDDGHVDPTGACFAMAKGARDLGSEVVRNSRVTGVRQLPGGEWEVSTQERTYRCEHVVNAGGYHARRIGAWSGLDLPITTLQHHYVVTDDVPEFDGMDHEIPVTRDDAFSGYLRREQKAALIGIYDQQGPKPLWLEGCPWDSENELFDPDWNNITPWLENCFKSCPALERRGIKRVVNGGITYTPDGAMILGPASGLRNHWLACGATVGIAWGPGAGRTLARWIVHGAPDVSTRAFDPRRFGVWVDGDYACERAVEEYSLRIRMPRPHEQKWTKRGIKLSGAHGRTKALRAVFEEAGGWERPRWYAPAAMAAQDITGYRRGVDFAVVAAECKAVRERVALGDFSAFAKFEVSGPGAEALLNRVCANRMPRLNGGTALTTLLNERGFIEGEAIVVRVGEEAFYMVTGAPSQRRVWDWITVHHRGEGDVEFAGVTDDIGILTLAGPQARAVLTDLTQDDVGNSSFPWLTARDVQVSGIKVYALRLSFTGEPAFELHCANRDLGTLWDCVWEAGEAHGIAAFGSYALNSLRMEKGYRGGAELANDATPLDAGLERFVKFDKEFIGRAPLERQKRAGPAYSLALLDISANGVDALGGEAVFADGRPAGSLTSAAYGHCVGKLLGFAFLRRDAVLPDADLQVSIFGELYPATILPEPPLDPQNLRLRA